MKIYFSAITTCVAVYRGKSSMIEYISAGAITGATYKFSMGLRGMTAGALVGGAFGTIAGGVTLLLLKSTGMTMEEARYWQYKWRSNRDDTVNDALKVDIRGSEIHEPLFDAHDSKHGTTNLDLKILDPVKKEAVGKSEK